MSNVPEGLFEEAEAAEVTSSPDSLRALQSLGAEALRLEAEVSDLEAEVASRNTRLYEIRSKDMVDLMVQAGVDSVTVQERVFDLGVKHKAVLPKDEEKGEGSRDAALQWLEDNQHGGIISNIVTAGFSKEFAEEAVAAERYLREHFQMAEVSRQRDVPWARLTSWLKNMFTTEQTRDEAQKIPLDVIGGKVERIVEIKKPKRSKRR